jgi:5-methylcytosine-specific restriction endonuclease McrA
MTQNWTKGSTRAWRKLRTQILERDNHTCQLQIQGICTHHATHVHHINGRTEGDNPNNLQAACAECNLHIGDPTMHRHKPTDTKTDPQPNLWTPPPLRP